MINKLKNLLLLKDANLYDPYTDKKNKGSILLEDGIIKEIGEISHSDNMDLINCNNKIVAPGLIDIHTHFREPGREDKETLKTGALAAMSGGFTRVCIMPNTNPPLDNPESIRFTIERSRKLPINIYPIAAITKNQEGKEITEIGSLVEAGAVAISDDGLPVQNGQVMRYAIEYASKFNIPVINHAEDLYLRNNGVINEGYLSTRLGLSGIPDISESIMVNRDLEIAEFCKGRIHIPHVSAKKSVDLIRKYKDLGVKVTAEVTPHHIGLSEHNIMDYDTNAKVAPPIRKDEDRKALIKALIDGTIDCIASDHAPHTIEEKEMDFINSPCGMIGLESAFGLSHTVLSKEGMTTEEIIKLFTKGPASIFNWNIKIFEINKLADLVVIDPTKKWIFKEKDIFSKSKNSPMLGMEFTGKVTSIISGGYILNAIND